MPAEKIELQQKQGRLFHQKLSIELNPKHKLYSRSVKSPKNKI